MSLRARILKEHARQSMKNAVTSPILVTLVFILLTTVLVEAVYTFIPQTTSNDLLSGNWLFLFLSILLSLYQSVMEFGYSCWSLNVADGQDEGIPSLLDGFGMVGRVLLMRVRIFLGILGRGMLLFFSYILLITSLAAMSSASLGLMLMLVASLIFYAALISLTLRYSLAPFVLCDHPEAGSLIAVHRSIELMHRHIWAMVKLYLSFWPWYLLQMVLTLVVAVVTLGPTLSTLPELYVSADPDALSIALNTVINSVLSSTLISLSLLPIQLFLQPYQNISLAHFYRTLSQQSGSQSFAGSGLS